MVALLLDELHLLIQDVTEMWICRSRTQRMNPRGPASGFSPGSRQIPWPPGFTLLILRWLLHILEEPPQPSFCNLRSLALLSFSSADSRKKKKTDLFPPECQNSSPERGRYRRSEGTA